MSFMQGKAVAVFLLTLWGSLTVQAQEPRPFYESTRALGMGGAQIAVVNDPTALLANPAGLGKLREFYGTLIDPQLDVGANAYQMYENTAISNPLDPSAVVTALNNNKNEYYHASGQVFPSMVVRNFGIGVFAREQLNMQMNSAGTQVSTFYTEDAVLALGYNFRFFDGRIKLGVTGKAIDRVMIDNTKMAYPGNFAISNNASEGAGLGADVGLNLTAPWTYLPTLSVVCRDVGNTTFTAGKNILMTSTTTPADLQQDFDVALAIFPIYTNSVRGSFTVEAQQIIQAQQSQDQMRYLHGGFELNFGDILFVRGGMNGHWPTAGIELASEHLQLQLAVYGEDVGQGNTVTEDQRGVVQLTFRF